MYMYIYIYRHTHAAIMFSSTLAKVKKVLPARIIFADKPVCPEMQCIAECFV